MLKAYRRLFVVYRDYRRHLVVCQALLFISGAAGIGMATLTQNTEVIIATGIWMALLALVAGVTMAAAAGIAVFFMQGTAWVIRTELYGKIQAYSFENFDRLRTGDILTRLSSVIDNVSWAVPGLMAIIAPIIYLSQGQRQMITIARAMVANPKILFLDEAASNVDTRTECLVQQGLQRLMKGRERLLPRALHEPVQGEGAGRPAELTPAPTLRADGRTSGRVARKQRPSRAAAVLASLG